MHTAGYLRPENDSDDGAATSSLAATSPLAAISTIGGHSPICCRNLV